jgi:hypothetical protein
MFILFQPSLPTGVTTIAISTVPPAAHTMSQPAHLLLQPVNQWGKRENNGCVTELCLVTGH